MRYFSCVSLSEHGFLRSCRIMLACNHRFM